MIVLAAHLWQSTLCAALAALVATVLRGGPARSRHVIWLLASLKFLVPFAALQSLGTIAGAWTPTVAVARTAGAFSWLDQVMPFWSLRVPAETGVAAAGTTLPAAAIAVWVTGAGALALWRWRAWRALREVARTARPPATGREIAALNRVLRTRRLGGVVLLESPRIDEPGVFGVVRPQILWPSGLSSRLTDGEIESIIAHELAHVGRRDNATILLHIVVETLFWFHPLVWWIGSRLTAERERACDEEVVRMGTSTRQYAEGLLKACGFSLRAPNGCAARAGDANLARRIERIVDCQPAPPLPAPVRLLLGCLGAAVMTAPLLAGALEVQPPDSGSASTTRPAAVQERGPEREAVPMGPGIQPPRLIHEVKPAYTEEAKAAKVHGVVLLEAVVLEDGTVDPVRVTRSLDKEHGLDDEAVKALRQWRFEPGRKDGEPVRVRVEIEMSFTLK